MKPVLVNPHHVEKSKELDDNDQTKNDRKDPKVIAGLVREGRYMILYLPDGVYADLRIALNIRFRFTGGAYKNSEQDQSLVIYIFS